MDPTRARCRTLRVGLGTGKVVRLPVADPFPHISLHVKKAPGVGGILAHISGLLKIVAVIRSAIPVIIGTGRINIIPPRVRGGRACPAGILPLGFRGQNIFPTIGQSTRGLLNRIKRDRKIWASSQEAFSTGRLLPLNWLGSAFKPSDCHSSPSGTGPG